MNSQNNLLFWAFGAAVGGMLVSLYKPAPGAPDPPSTTMTQPNQGG